METNPFNWKPGFLEDLSSLSGHPSILGGGYTGTGFIPAGSAFH